MVSDEDGMDEEAISGLWIGCLLDVWMLILLASFVYSGVFFVEIKWDLKMLEK